MGWVLPIVAILLEVAGTTNMKRPRVSPLDTPVPRKLSVRAPGPITRALFVHLGAFGNKDEYQLRSPGSSRTCQSTTGRGFCARYAQYLAENLPLMTTEWSL